MDSLQFPAQFLPSRFALNIIAKSLAADHPDVDHVVPDGPVTSDMVREMYRAYHPELKLLTCLFLEHYASGVKIYDRRTESANRSLLHGQNQLDKFLVAAAEMEPLPAGKLVLTVLPVIMGLTATVLDDLLDELKHAGGPDRITLETYREIGRPLNMNPLSLYVLAKTGLASGQSLAHISLFRHGVECCILVDDYASKVSEAIAALDAEAVVPEEEDEEDNPTLGL